VETTVSEPLISVITPFYNTAPFLAECIESVLAQSYTNFEYILSDNCSADGSTEIAQSYARRDPRIRLVRQPRRLPQVQHYNAALSEISSASEYCKMVQADDCIFRDSLVLLKQAFEQSKNIGLASSYDLKGNTLRGSGCPYPATFVCGREVAKLNLRTGVFLFGSPSTVMYRSSLVREKTPFFEEGLLHEDTEKCMAILEHWDFGFVHQVLAFLRADNESISSAVKTYRPQELDHYIIVRRFASRFLDSQEASALKRKTRRSYYSALAEEVVRLRSKSFWKYHQTGLRTLGEKLDVPYLGLQTAKQLAWMAVNPGMAFIAVRETAKRVSRRVRTG
jgi:glycosyltransferase involved in cell wall biosynthesis